MSKSEVKNNLMRPIRLITLLSAFTIVLSCKKHEVIHEYKLIEPNFDRSFTDSLVESTDEAALAAQLPVLRHLPLDDSLWEVRIWTFFGAMIPQGFYSIELTEGVSGRRIWYFKQLGEEWSEEEVSEFKEDLNSYCEKLGKNNETETCVDTELSLDWEGVYGDLEELGIWDLPDDSEIQKYVIKDFYVLDGTIILVEVKKPGFYRSYFHKYEVFSHKKNHRYANKILEIINKDRK